MITEPVRRHITNVLSEDLSEGPFLAKLYQIAAQQGLVMDASQEAEAIRITTAYVWGAPELIEACWYHAQNANVAQYSEPLLQQAIRYFLEDEDVIPDHFGLLGLVDDAYLVYGYVQSISDAYRQLTGFPLLDLRIGPAASSARVLLGQDVAAILDRTIRDHVQQLALQNSVSTLAQRRARWNVGYRTGGPGSWGGCVEDEIARMSAELGISL